MKFVHGDSYRPAPRLTRQAVAQLVAAVVAQRVVQLEPALRRDIQRRQFLAERAVRSVAEAAVDQAARSGVIRAALDRAMGLPDLTGVKSARLANVVRRVLLALPTYYQEPARSIWFHDEARAPAGASPISLGSAGENDVHLSPALAVKSDAEIVRVVAHELAHVLRGDHGRLNHVLAESTRVLSDTARIEAEAEALASEWMEDL